MRLEQVTVRYRTGGAQIVPLRQVTFTLAPGASALMGPSGSGKSTLLRLIAGQQVPTSSAVTQAAPAALLQESVNVYEEDRSRVHLLAVAGSILVLVLYAAGGRALLAAGARDRAVLSDLDLAWLLPPAAAILGLLSLVGELSRPPRRDEE